MSKIWYSLAMLHAVTMHAALAASMPLDFAGAVDRFELSGNLSGGFVDEFDDGVVAPWFVNALGGTVSESGGLLNLTDPGYQDLGVMPALPLLAETSEVLLFSPQVADGSGDFVATSTWIQAVPDINDTIGMGLNYNLVDVGMQENAYLVLVNAGPDLAALFNLTPGLYVVQNSSRQPIGGGSGQPGQTVPQVFDFAPIQASDVTGPILLRLSFDDSADTFTGSFSLDGGGSFASPFSPIPSHMTGYNEVFFLDAIAYQVVPEPGTIPLLGLAGIAVWVAYLRRIT